VPGLWLLQVKVAKTILLEKSGGQMMTSAKKQNRCFQNTTYLLE
jgi:hypothetical protein